MRFCTVREAAVLIVIVPSVPLTFPLPGTISFRMLCFKAMAVKRIGLQLAADVTAKRTIESLKTLTPYEKHWGTFDARRLRKAESEANVLGRYKGESSGLEHLFDWSWFPLVDALFSGLEHLFE